MFRSNPFSVGEGLPLDPRLRVGSAHGSSIADTRPQAKGGFPSLVWLAAIAVLCGRSSLAAQVPRFETAPCRPTVHQDERVDCGMLIVWENRQAHSGPLLHIPVKIFRSRSGTPSPDPILFMIGGPGLATRNRTGRDLPYLDTRDYIIFDQRGTALADPHLDCNDVALVKQRIAHGTLRAAAAQEAWGTAAEACGRRLRSGGIDLTTYTTRAIAADVEDLRTVLHLAHWNLYGVSYSARVMLTVMREYPAAVRSVVLDSPLPLESRPDEVGTNDVLRSIDLVLDACAVDAQCAARHASVRANTAAAIRRFDEHPMWLKVSPDSTHTDSLLVHGAEIASGWYDLLNNPRSAALLPFMIDHAAAGDIQSMAPIYAEDLGLSDFALGMRIAVWCADIVSFEDRARVAAQHDLSLGMGGADFGSVPPTACDAMGIPPSPAIEGQPVRSAIPTLILSGGIDPNTPTPWARSMLRDLTNAFLVEIPGASHGPGFSECGMRLIEAFVDDPTLSPTDNCVTKAPAIMFAR